MNLTKVYLAKHSFRPSIDAEPNAGLNLCMVIPCYNETGLISSLESIWNCARPAMTVEVIVVINSPENCSSEILERNLVTLNEANTWIDGHFDKKLRFHLIYRPDLPQKFAGVGLARKIGMDEAAYRLSKINPSTGIIASFDADTVCDSNYLTELEHHFKKNTKTLGASIYFEHPISGITFTNEVYTGICLYELHLRYLNQAMRYAGHPHSFHTVGSSFAVRADTYVKQGGMNKRQAGEDFYFLQKVIALGNFSEINTTTVHPSPRESSRVPFGTGASMMRWKTEKVMKTYHINALEDIKDFISISDQFFKSPPSHIPSFLAPLSSALQDFLQMSDFENELKSVVTNCATVSTFKPRFFRWFNAFKVIKYLNYSHDKYYTKSEITEESSVLIQKLGFQANLNEPKELLDFYRTLDKSGFGLISQ
jgi:hypothetical protein